MHEGRRVFAFTRARHRTRSYGAVARRRVGRRRDEPPPEPLDAAIIFAPAGDLVPAALRATAPGGAVVCAGIHMRDIPSFPYRSCGRSGSLRSVANLTRADAHEFLELAPQIPIRTTVQEFTLEDAEEALERLRAGRIEGAAVLRVRQP